MNLLLLNPPFLTIHMMSLAFGEPLGLAYVAASVERSKRHQVEILDGVGSATEIRERKPGEHNWIGMAHADVLAEISKRHFDAIGISLCNACDVDPGTTALIRKIKEQSPGTPIIVGGPEASHNWEAYARNTDISFVVIGEGEYSLVQLLDAIEAGTEVKDVKGLAFLDEDGSVFKTEDPEIVDINSIPWPARHLIPLQIYIENRPTTKNRAVTILTSRACPFSCAFCSMIKVWGNKWRGRSPRDVVDEIEFLIKEYDIKEVRIQDDNFCVNRKRVHEICDLMIDRNIDIEIVIDPGVMASLADEDLLRKMNKAGLKNINMQLESGSLKTQKYISKPIDLDHIRNMVRVCHELKMKIRTNIIIGFPFETKEDMIESVTNAVDAGFDHIEFIYLNPIRSTRVRRDFIEAGIIEENDNPTLPIRTLHCSAEEVREVYNFAASYLESRRHLPTKGQSLRLDPAVMFHVEGYCYAAPVPEGRDIADHENAPCQSPARLFEDGRYHGLNHAMHRHIGTMGEGRYSHWQTLVYFSTSDNSDPRTNGRQYLLEY